MPYSLLLFDADQTLFDFDKSEKISLFRALQSCGVSCSDRLLAAYRVINKSLWLEYERGLVDRETLQYARFERLRRKFSFTLDVHAVSGLYLTALSQCSYLMNGAREVCDILSKKYPMAIVTNGISQVQRARVNHSEIAEFFDNIFVSEDTGYQKPEAGFFDYVFRFYPGIKRENTLVIGDSLTADILGGNNAGIATCWLNPGGLPAESRYRIDHEIHSLNELCNIL